MKILAIETSCDETSIAFLEANGNLKDAGPNFKILENLVALQINIHRPYGGVVPNLAKREHLKNLPILFKRISSIKNLKIKPDVVAVTVGPGLEPALWTGINFAKNLYSQFTIRGKKIKIIGVSHLEGHLFSYLLNKKNNLKNKKIFPAIALIISGGHTSLLLMKDLAHYKKLGETRDDAVGECFDKVARLLSLPYPGGPEIEKMAQSGKSSAVCFPRPMLSQKNYDFSFSGLKTAVLYYVRDNKNFKKEDVAASFQEAAFDVLILKSLRAAKEFKAKSIIISGGVAANKTLQKRFKLNIKNAKLKASFLAPSQKLCADNAAMIAVAGYINYLRKKNRRLAAKGNLSL